MKALAVTAALFFLAVSGLVTWLALDADSLGGQPHVEMAIELPKTLPKSSQPKSVRANTINGIPVVRKSDNVDIGRSVGAQDASAGQGQLSDAAQDGSSNGNKSGAMAPVPINALVERSLFGPLPKISEDGRQPAIVYARPSSYTARTRPGEPAKIAILITGLGLSSIATHEVIHNLPGPVTLAFSPYGHSLQAWVRKAREMGHEVMMQVPFEPYDYPDNDPGPHTLLTSLSPKENIKRLHWLMSRFSGYIGLTNAMGAKFMSSGQALQPIMKEMKNRGLIYFENGMTARSAAGQISQSFGMDYGQAQVQIDTIAEDQEIQTGLNRLEELALEQGISLGVASNLPITIRSIREWSRTLKDKGIVLIPISAALNGLKAS